MTDLIKFNDTYYQLVRRVRVSEVGDNLEGLKAWRDFLYCDHVLQNGEYYLMVRYVDEVEFTEE